MRMLLQSRADVIPKHDVSRETPRNQHTGSGFPAGAIRVNRMCYNRVSVVLYLYNP